MSDIHQTPGPATLALFGIIREDIGKLATKESVAAVADDVAAIKLGMNGLCTKVEAAETDIETLKGRAFRCDATFGDWASRQKFVEVLHSAGAHVRSSGATRSRMWNLAWLAAGAIAGVLGTGMGERLLAVFTGGKP